MNADQTLLNFIHKNAAMGVGTIPHALALPQSRAMERALSDQLREYRAIAARSQAYARSHRAPPPLPCPAPCCGPRPPPTPAPQSWRR